MTTNIAGTSATSMTLAVVSSSRRRLDRLTTKADKARIKSTLPSSDAWKEKSGNSIARWAPNAVLWPSASTARMLRIKAP